MSVGATALLLAFLLDGLLEGVRWADIEDKWLRWPEGEGSHDFYHLSIGGRNAAFVVAAMVGVAIVPLIGACLVGFALRELAMDAVVAQNRWKPWTYLFRRSKQSLYGFKRYPLAERIAALLLGGWLLT